MKKVALLIFPEFSIQEVASLMYIFRWFYDTKTVTFSSSKKPVYSEEGIAIMPEKTFEEFNKDDYYCLVLPGCSDFKEVLTDEKLFMFLHSFKEDNKFVIGAICGGPILLSLAGLLDNKKFVSSSYYEMNKGLSAINYDNFTFQPVVVDGNIVSAVGDAFREFAIEIARCVGFECRDKALSGLPEKWDDNYFIHHLPAEEIEEFNNKELPQFESVYQNLKSKF